MRSVKIPWSRNERILSRYKRIISLIHEQVKDYLDMPDEVLREKTYQLKERHFQGETLDDLLVEAFALVVGACKRLVGRSWEVCNEAVQWKMVPYDEQMMGAIALFQGKIVEMATGEG
ncbi:MAG: preprotein translocase subunit SecA, partial [Chlamydiota bacterium]|nr:preprotein translocase subunit SecA [Chlamydiota bacterium]